MASATLLTLAFMALAAAILVANPANHFGWVLLAGALILVGAIVKGEMKGRH